ncbi:MAG: ABC transporter permease subunit [Verrucomicrobia bacterium]|nr:ABC transporter permease subunit [Verrucomicrobiota bacterium]
MNEIYTIAKNSFMELLRQPVFLILTAAASAFIVFLAVTPYFGLGDDVKLVKTSTMAVLLVAGLFTAVISATSSLADELKGGTALAVLSKPVSRLSFLLGKLLGVCGGLVVMVYINAIAILLASRMGYDAYGATDKVGMTIFYLAMMLAFGIAAFINYFLERNFVSNAVGALLVMLTLAFILISFFDEHWMVQKFAEGTDWNMVPAIICLLFMLWLIVALAIACSTRLDAVATLSVCIIFLMVGLVSDHFFGRLADAGSWIGTVLYTVIPNWQNFWLADAIEGEKGIPWLYIGHAFIYMACFMAAVIAIGLCMFDNRELS